MPGYRQRDRRGGNVMLNCKRSGTKHSERLKRPRMTFPRPLRSCMRTWKRMGCIVPIQFRTPTPGWRLCGLLNQAKFLSIYQSAVTLYIESVADLAGRNASPEEHLVAWKRSGWYGGSPHWHSLPYNRTSNNTNAGGIELAESVQISNRDAILR